MSARLLPKLAMRPMLPADVPLLAEIFRAAVAELTVDDYSEAQREAWASAADDEAEFGAKLAGALTLGRDLRRRRGRLRIARRQSTHRHALCASGGDRGRAPAPCSATRWKSSPPRAAPRN